MIIYPAIDIRHSKCVRLYQGDYTQETIYSHNPLAIAKKFCDEGATWIHVVDLNGAENPEYHQASLISEIINHARVNIQTGGGIRSKEQIVSLLNHGAERVIIGSMSIQNPNEVSAWLNFFGSDRIVLALDIIYRDNHQAMITTNAWKNISDYSLIDMLHFYESFGLKHVLCTNISLDGTLNGPDYELYDSLLKQFPNLCIQASGGIQSIKDVTWLREKGLSGAIIGRALYENKFSLSEVLAC